MSKTYKANCMSVSSIDSLVKQLKVYSKDLDTRTEEVVKRLIKIGCEVIEKQIASASFKYDTTSNGNVIESGAETAHNTQIKITNLKGYTHGEIQVTGEDIIFIEFGAGVYYNGAVGSSPHPKGVQNNFLIGTYGYGLGARKVWGYTDDNGQRILTHGTKATMPMYLAITKMYLEAPKVIREVYGK